MARIIVVLLVMLAWPAEAKQCVEWHSSGDGAYVVAQCQEKRAAKSREPFRVSNRWVRPRVAHIHQTRGRKVAARAVRSRMDKPAALAVGSDRLVTEAARHVGQGAVFGRPTLWCGRFLAVVVRSVGGQIPHHPDLARNWAALPRTRPRVGAIAVLSRRGGGHVGVVSGFDGRGNPILISGNDGRKVRERVYPRSRVYAWVKS
jgi:uncharacterized protein (TIGR02594 family)